MKIPRLQWQPDLAPDHYWITQHLRKYLGRRSFTLYSNGSCVVWAGNEKPETPEANRRLQNVTLQHPDFKVQRHVDGNFLVTFKGGVGGILSGETLINNLTRLRQEALTLGVLPGERLLVDRHDNAKELEVVAGLYVRAQLYRDIDELIVVTISHP